MRNRSSRTLVFLVLALLASGIMACVPIQAPAASSTAAPLVTVAAPLPTPMQQDIRLSGQLPSPDGTWTASYIAAYPAGRAEYYQRLVVRADDGDPRYVIVDAWSPLALGYTVALPLQWSDDSQRLYYTNRPTADGCGILLNGSDLNVIEVGAGMQRQLLPAVGGVISLAPDEHHVAYRPWGTQGLTIQNLDTGVIKSIALDAIVDDGMLGALTWSPDSSILAFVVAHRPCSGDWAQSSSIYTLNRTTLSLIPHLVRDERLLLPASWQEDRTLRLETVEGDQFALDITDNSVTPIPPTN